MVGILEYPWSVAASLAAGLWSVVTSRSARLLLRLLRQTVESRSGVAMELGEPVVAVGAAT